MAQTERREVDARDVLDKYIVLVRKTRGRSPLNAADLPAPKHVIKEILLHVLRLAPCDGDVTPLRMAYLTLAEFQDFRGSATATIEKWLQQTEKAASDTVNIREFLDSLQNQIDDERVLLSEELAKAGF